MVNKNDLTLICNCSIDDIKNAYELYNNYVFTIIYNVQTTNNVKQYINKIQTRYYLFCNYGDNLYDCEIFDKLTGKEIRDIDVSILIPTYNCEKFIKDSIDSCLNQNFNGVYEIVIVDDGSTDNTIELISSYKNLFIKLYQKTHSGISDTLNYGLTKCRGKYICRMDGDDIMYTNRLSLQYKYMERHQDVDVLSNGMVCFNTDMTAIKEDIPICNYDCERITFDNIANFCSLHHPCIFAKNGIYDYYYISKFDGYEDYELWFRLLRCGYKIASWHVPVLKYRYRKNSNSHNLSIVNDVEKLKRIIYLEANKSIGIYYIATGVYKNNFNEFLSSIENFFYGYKKHIILLSDGLGEYDNYKNGNVTIEHHYIDDMPWPIVTLFKFHYLLKYKVNDDYIFYINSNAIINPNKLVDWFNPNMITLTKHYSYRFGFLTTYELLTPSDDNPNSQAYIGNITYTYCQGGFFGGPTKKVYDMCEEIIKLIDVDLNNNIIAKWHDESYLNKWAYVHNYNKDIMNITDVFYTDKCNKEVPSNFIYLKYMNETDDNYNKKIKLQNKIEYGKYVPEHNYEKDKNTLNMI